MRDPASTFAINRLYEALDECRRARGLSWQQLAHEIGGVSPATLSGIPRRRVIEGDGALQMLRWLDRSAESFLTPPGEDGPPLPAVGRGQILRFDTRGIYAALDAQRQARGLTWTEVAAAVGAANGASLTRLSKGGRTSFPDIVPIVRWLNRSVSSVVHVSDW
jgi:uncharacterized protein YfiM (DUF2279 family)